MSLLRGRVADMGSFAHLFGARTPAKAETPAEPEAEIPAAEPECEDPPVDPPAAEDPPAEDSPEDEKQEGETPAAARAAERARCAAIFAAPSAANNVALAAHLAFETDLPAEQVIGALALGGSKPAGGLAARMSNAPNPVLGTGAPPKASADSADTLAAQITASARVARGGKA